MFAYSPSTNKTPKNGGLYLALFYRINSNNLGDNFESKSKIVMTIVEW